VSFCEAPFEKNTFLLDAVLLAGSLSNFQRYVADIDSIDALSAVERSNNRFFPLPATKVKNDLVGQPRPDVLPKVSFELRSTSSIAFSQKLTARSLFDGSFARDLSAQKPNLPLSLSSIPIPQESDITPCLGLAQK
jgi:hypothetical protein